VTRKTSAFPLNISTKGWNVYVIIALRTAVVELYGKCDFASRKGNPIRAQRASANHPKLASGLPVAMVILAPGYFLTRDGYQAFSALKVAGTIPLHLSGNGMLFRPILKHHFNRNWHWPAVWRGWRFS